MRQLLPPVAFRGAMDRYAASYLEQGCRDMGGQEPFNIGVGRFAYEHWLGSRGAAS